MLKKLRGRFVMINMAIIAAMLIIIFVLIFHITQSDLQQESDTLVQTLSQAPVQSERPGRNTRLPYFVLQVSIWGDVTISSNSNYDLSDEAFLQDLLQSVLKANREKGYLPQYSLKYGVSHNPGGQKFVFVDVSGINATLTTLRNVLILIGALSLAAFGIISVLLARWAVKPVEKAWQQQKQFVSDASHELKTPLTVIISNAELLQAEQPQPQQDAPFTQNILSSAQQMRTLVEGMLDLARAENGQMSMAFEKIDLSSLCEEALLPFEPLFFEKGLLLESSIAPGIFVNGSHQHILQVIGILLDNAGKYSDRGVVTVTLQRQGRSQCLLQVANPGEPIPKEELEKVFERFYRVDKARTQDGSFGLGLSIAQRIVQEHKGTIWAESNPSGNRFCVQLPCEPSA